MFIGSFDAQKYELITILATVWRHFFVLPPLPDVWSSQIGERYKLVERELLWTLRHQGMVEEVMWQRGCIDNLSEADTQHLTALVEDGLHYPLEYILVAAKRAGIVARHPDDGTLDLWWRIEDRLVNSKQIFHACIRTDSMP